MKPKPTKPSWVGTTSRSGPSTAWTAACARSRASSRSTGTRARARWTFKRKGGREVVRAAGGAVGARARRPRFSQTVRQPPARRRPARRRQEGDREKRRDVRIAVTPRRAERARRRARGRALVGTRTPFVVPPSLDEYETLSNASEYAAWTLVHGHALNHVAVAVHRLFERERASRDSPPRRRFASLKRAWRFWKAPPLSTKTSRAGVAKSRFRRTGVCAKPPPSRTFSSLGSCRTHSRGTHGVSPASTRAKDENARSRCVEFVDRASIAGDGAARHGGAYVPERLRRRLRNRKRGRHLRIHVPSAAERRMNRGSSRFVRFVQTMYDSLVY